MVSPAIAHDLQRAGLRWHPRPGDAFFLPGRGMDDEVFHLSDMTVELHDFPTGQVIGFNGVTEWALDSVDRDDAVWLPEEHQLRDLLAGMFQALTRREDGWEVRLALPDGSLRRVVADTAPDAYGLALLEVLHEVAGARATAGHG